MFEGTVQTTLGDGQTTAGANVMNLYKTFYTGAWTNTGVKIMYFTAFQVQLV